MYVCGGLRTRVDKTCVVTSSQGHTHPRGNPVVINVTPHSGCKRSAEII